MPNPQEWHLISDANASELFDESPDDVAVEQVLDRAGFAYKCEQCDRLHVYRNGLGDWPPTIYARESG